MNSAPFIDDAREDRQRLIATADWRTTAQQLADRVMELERAMTRARGWLDLDAPGRAREELSEAL